MTNQANSSMTPLVRQQYRLLCGIPALADELSGSLESCGWKVCADAELTLVIDGPWGVALQTLGQGGAGEAVVVTDNPCPEYWEDLWSLRPRALLIGGHRIPEVAEALERAQAGEYFRRVPHHESSLTCVERKLLRYSAMGWENKRMAREFELTEGTVKNGMNRIFHKMGFDNRTQVALYCWGLWHLLEPHPLRCHSPRRN